MIDWQAFTPISFIGGIIIGIATVLLLLGNGRIAGISGIVSYVIKPKKSEQWQWLFILGLIIAPIVVSTFYTPVTAKVTNSLPLLIISGLFVGFGTRLGSGCTSGHGICGNARFSPRSFIATLTFMSVGMFTVFIAKNLLHML